VTPPAVYTAADMKADLKPDYVPADAWDAVWANFAARVGANLENLLTVMQQDRSYLATVGDANPDLGSLIYFELGQAGLAEIGARYQAGAFGRGRPAPWEMTATADSHGVVTVRAGMAARRFTPEAGVFLAAPGDYGTLSEVGSHYELREKDGVALVFHDDGTLDYVEDPNGNTITFNYSGGQVTSITYPNGDVETVTYNGQGRVASITDAVGRVLTFAYNGSGEHLLSATGPLGTTSFTYVSGQGAAREHALASVTTPDGVTQSFTYDAQGRLSGGQLTGGAEAFTVTYPSVGCQAVTDALSNVTRMCRNGSGQVARLVDPLVNVTNLLYDGAGNLERIFWPDGSTTEYAYDLLGNVIRVVDPLGNETELLYEPYFSNLTRLTDPNGNQIHYAYDANGNLASITYPGGGSESFTYGTRGLLASWTNQRGQTVSYTHNAADLLTEKDPPGAPLVTYAYDAHRNLDSVTDPSGVNSYTYDGADRMTGVNYPSGLSLDFGYDLGYRRDQWVDQDGFIVDYAYDAAGRLAALTDISGTTIISYTYDAAGQLVEELKGNGAQTTYAYDTAGRMTRIEHRSPQDVLQAFFEYAYDAMGQPISLETMEGRTDLAYDLAGQLTRATFPDGRTVQYAYDAAGNRTSVDDDGAVTSYTTNALNQYTAVGAATYTYDLDGNLATKTQGGVTTYTFDPENRLVGVSGPGITQTYEYDAFGKLMAADQGVTRIEYLLDPSGLGNLVGEYDDLGNPLARYVHGAGLASRVDDSGLAAYYGYDLTGNAALLTDHGGAAVNTYAYLPFGQLRDAVIGLDNPFVFNGRWGVQTGASDQHYMRARWYDAALGRFASPDPIGLAGGDANLYIFVQNGPIKFIDPWGTTRVTAQTFKDILKNPKSAAWWQARVTWHVSYWGTRLFLTQTSVGRFIEGEVAGTIEYKLFRSPRADNWGERGKQHLEGCPTPCDGTVNHGPSPHSRKVGSADPNDIVGPAGFGPQGWIAGDAPLAYMIPFENVMTATAPAATVTLSQTLDADLDLSTFELGAFGWAGRWVTPPAGVSEYAERLAVEISDTCFLYVDVAATLDTNTRLATWTFTAIDPETGAPPGPGACADGFLFPNDGAHRGEGFVSYDVWAQSAAPTGTVLDAQASIVFDTNPAILTPAIFNTLDVDKPSGSVGALPPTSPATFDVALNGDDGGGSGIAFFEVYVSSDGGPFELWQPAATGPQVTYTGVIGHNYAFYLVAVDNVTHQSATPGAAQASTMAATYAVHLPVIRR